MNNYPASRIAQLAASSVWYTNANCSCPSDSMPGTVALATGASSKTHGMWYDTAYSRALWPPLNAGGTPDCSGPPGTPTNYDESIDLLYDPSLQYTVTSPGGGCATRNGVGGCGINPDALPRKLLANGSCVPWYPHNEVRRRRRAPARRRARRPAARRVGRSWPRGETSGRHRATKRRRTSRARADPRTCERGSGVGGWGPGGQVRVNTMYEVAKAGNYITLFSDKHLSYEARRNPPPARKRARAHTHSHSLTHSHTHTRNDPFARTGRGATR